jgi:hypothetical protein
VRLVELEDEPVRERGGAYDEAAIPDRAPRDAELDQLRLLGGDELREPDVLVARARAGARELDELPARIALLDELVGVDEARARVLQISSQGSTRGVGGTCWWT